MTRKIVKRSTFFLSKGGILEPEGIVEIKFKMKDIIKTMHRLDNDLKDYKNRLTSDDLTQEEKSELEAKLSAREGHLSPMYHQVALHFADLHDTPARMHDKGVIQDVVPWRKSRSILHMRLKRLLLQNRVLRHMIKLQPTLNDGQALAMLRRWFLEDKGTMEVYLWDDNVTVINWLEEQLQLDDSGESIIRKNMKSVQKEAVIEKVISTVQDNPNIVLDTMVELFQKLPAQQRSEVLLRISHLEAANPSLEATSQEGTS